MAVHLQGMPFGPPVLVPPGDPLQEIPWPTMDDRIGARGTMFAVP